MTTRARFGLLPRKEFDTVREVLPQVRDQVIDFWISKGWGMTHPPRLRTATHIYRFFYQEWPMEANCINSSPSQKLLQQYPDTSPGTRVYQYRPPLLGRTCVFLGARRHF